jgi:hypothetical protein
MLIPEVVKTSASVAMSVFNLNCFINSPVIHKNKKIIKSANACKLSISTVAVPTIHYLLLFVS